MHPLRAEAGFLVHYGLHGGGDGFSRLFLDVAEKHGLLRVFLDHVKDRIMQLPPSCLWGVFDYGYGAELACDSALRASEDKAGLPRGSLRFDMMMVSSIRQHHFYPRGPGRYHEPRKRPRDDLRGPTVFETCRNHQLRDRYFALRSTKPRRTPRRPDAVSTMETSIVPAGTLH